MPYVNGYVAGYEDLHVWIDRYPEPTVKFTAEADGCFEGVELHLSPPRARALAAALVAAADLADSGGPSTGARDASEWRDEYRPAPRQRP